MDLKKTALFFLVLFALNITNKVLGQTQIWLGAHLYVRDIGISTGIVTKDKLIFKYSFTPRESTLYGYQHYTLAKAYASTFSSGWVFTKPQSKIRIGGGLTLIHFYNEDKEYDNNSILVKSESNSVIYPIPFPFFYIDYKIKNNIKLVFNTSIFLNEIGVGYRFNKKLKNYE
jgi:hypothetical protein